MSVEVADLVASLRGTDSGFSGMMASAESRLKTLASSTDKTTSKLADVGLAIGAAAVGIGIYSVKAAANYEQLTTTLVTGGGEQLANLEMVRQGMLTMAGQVGENADDLAKGMYYVESASFHGAAGLQVLQAAAEGAKIGMTDDISVAQGLTTELKDYHQSASLATGVTGQMVAAVAAGKQTMGEFSSSLATILPTAAALHISFQQISAAEATMTEDGVPAADAATALRSAMEQLINPSTAAKQAMMQLGINVTGMRTALASGDLTGVMNTFSVAMGNSAKNGMSQANIMRDLGVAFGGIKGQSVAMNLIPNMGEYTANLSTIGTVQQGARKETASWQLTQKDLNDQLDRTGAALNSAAIMLGTTFLPQISGFLTNDLNPVIAGMDTWIAQNPRVVSTIEKIGLAVGALALAEKLSGPLRDALGLIGLIRKAAGAGSGKGFATPLMNVTADVVNVTGAAGAAGDLGKGAAAGGGTSLLSKAVTATAGVTAAAASADFVKNLFSNADFVQMAQQASLSNLAGNLQNNKAAIAASTAKNIRDSIGGVGNDATSIVNGVLAGLGVQPGSGGSSPLAGFYAGSTGKNIMATLNNPGGLLGQGGNYLGSHLPTFGLGGGSGGSNQVTVHVNAGAVQVQGGNVGPGYEQAVAQMLGQFTQQWVHAQKALGSGAKGNLPGAIGGTK